MIRVQIHDFNIGEEIDILKSQQKNIGAVASFVGVARDFNEGDVITTLTLEHYPGMTEKALEKIVQDAKTRWELIAVTVIHRVGLLKPADNIVFVGVACQHRTEAFKACEFIMDLLKTSAPFWKKESAAEGDRWLDAKHTDDEAANRWHNS